MKTDCAHYTTIAAQYAKTWESYAFTSEGSAPHYKVSVCVCVQMCVAMSVPVSNTFCSLARFSPSHTRR